jgi:hypothetical protein
MRVLRLCSAHHLIGPGRRPLRYFGKDGYWRLLAVTALAADEQCTDANAEGRRAPRTLRQRISSGVTWRSGSEDIVDSAEFGAPETIRTPALRYEVVTLGLVCFQARVRTSDMSGIRREAADHQYFLAVAADSVIAARENRRGRARPLFYA